MKVDVERYSSCGSILSKDLRRKEVQAYTLKIDGEDGLKTEVFLMASELEHLVSRATEELAFVYAAAEEELYRSPARKMLLMRDKEIQEFLRRIPISLCRQILTSFLWYMDTPDLMEKILTLVSPHISSVIRADIEETCHFVIPETASLSRLRKGREDTSYVLEILHTQESGGWDEQAYSSTSR